VVDLGDRYQVFRVAGRVRRAVWACQNNVGRLGAMCPGRTPEGGPNPGKEKLNSPKTYLHVRSYPDRHVRSHADNACGSCDSRYLGEQWCHDCNRPCQRLGAGGTCPSCQEVVLL